MPTLTLTKLIAIVRAAQDYTDEELAWSDNIEDRAGFDAVREIRGYDPEVWKDISGGWVKHFREVRNEALEEVAKWHSEEADICEKQGWPDEAVVHRKSAKEVRGMKT